VDLDLDGLSCPSELRTQRVTAAPFEELNTIGHIVVSSPNVSAYATKCSLSFPSPLFLLSFTFFHLILYHRIRSSVKETEKFSAIRVTNKAAKETRSPLLKYHKEDIVDMSLFGRSVGKSLDFLASVSRDGTVYVTSIEEDEDTKQIKSFFPFPNLATSKPKTF